MSNEEITLARKHHKALAPLLAQEMRDEAEDLRGQYPNSEGYEGLVGSAVARYVRVMREITGEVDEFDYARKDAYQLTE